MNKIAFLFPGQGSQYIGMGKQLYNEFDVFRKTIEEANNTLGYDLGKICFEGSMGELGKIINMLPGILMISVATFRVFKQEFDIDPQFGAGHSLGEFSALTCSGAIQLSDALKIVYKRSKLAQEIADMGIGTMTIIDGVDSDIMVELCRNVSNESKKVAVSCFNSLNQVAISGHCEAVMKVEEKALEYGAQITPLLSSAPFHSVVMQPAVAELKAELQKYSYRSLEWPVISNVTALPYSSPEAIIENLSTQLIKPVQWQFIMEFLKKQGVTSVVEFGSQNILCNLFKNQYRSIRTFAYLKQDDKNSLIKFLNIHGDPYTAIIEKCIAISVGTPNYNQDNEEYRNGVIEPYKILHEISKKMETQTPSKEVIKTALDTLQTILTYKKISKEDQAEWFKEISFIPGGKHILSDIRF